jgi:hypothetical protein
VSQKTGRAFALVSMLLAGCSSGGNSNYAQFGQILRSSLAATFSKQKITRNQAAEIPFASMGWRLAGGNQSIIVLATDNNGEELWTSAARIVIVTRDGRVVRTVGLGHDIGGAWPQGGVPLLPPAAALKQNFTSSRLVDYPDTGRYGVAITCSTHAANRETIDIFDQKIAAVRVDEVCDSNILRWHFTDNYWVDPQDGTVWRSRQHIHPKLDPLVTELFRPPSKS